MAARSDPIGRGTDTHRYGGVPEGQQEGTLCV